jgi:hypothetical protein
MVAMGVESTAVATGRPDVEHGAETIVVLGAVPEDHRPGATVHRSDLRRSGIDRGSDLESAGDHRAEPDEARALSTNPGNVVHSWRDGQGHTVLLRQTPLAKVAGHGLTVRTVRRVTQLTNRELQSYTSYRYQTNATEYRCSWLRCTVVRRQAVRVIADFRRLNDNRQYGVVTAYCPGAGQVCPNWVNTHIN